MLKKMLNQICCNIIKIHSSFCKDVSKLCQRNFIFRNVFPTKTFNNIFMRFSFITLSYHNAQKLFRIPFQSQYFFGNKSTVILRNFAARNGILQQTLDMENLLSMQIFYILVCLFMWYIPLYVWVYSCNNVLTILM